MASRKRPRGNIEITHVGPTTVVESSLLDRGDVARALRDAGVRRVENHDLVAMAADSLDPTIRALAHEVLIRRGARPVAVDADPRAMLQEVLGGRMVCVRCGLVDAAERMRGHLCGRSYAARTADVVDVHVILDNLEGATCQLCRATYSHKHMWRRCTTCGAAGDDVAMRGHACAPTHPPQQKPKPAPAAPAGGDDEIW